MGRSVDLDAFVAVVRSGEQVVSFPTDTVPALAARPEFAGLIYEAKNRSLEKSLILMAGDEADLWSYLVGDEAERSIWSDMMQRYFPGAVTLVLPASDRVSKKMNARTPGQIGVRVPNCEAARKILRATGPLATTSVNRSGEPALLSLAEIRSQFPAALTLTDEALRSLGVSDPYAPAQGTPSTVVRWTGTGWEILRQGMTIVEEGM